LLGPLSAISVKVKVKGSPFVSSAIVPAASPLKFPQKSFDCVPLQLFGFHGLSFYSFTACPVHIHRMSRLVVCMLLLAACKPRLVTYLLRVVACLLSSVANLLNLNALLFGSLGSNTFCSVGSGREHRKFIADRILLMYAAMDVYNFPFGT
jgi:hypothetical protein